MKLLKNSIVMLLATTLLCMSVPGNGSCAADKPARPSISVKSVNETDAKITIKATEGALGYRIYMKSPSRPRYSMIKTLNLDGTVKRTYTVTGLSEGQYYFKVMAYSKVNGKMVWSSFSKVKELTINKPASVVVSDYSKAKTGDIILFGSYEQDNDLSNGKEPIEWIVLSNSMSSRGTVLYLMSKYALDCKLYNETSVDITWENCTLRKWLNNDFYNEAFNNSEKLMVLISVLKNDDNPDWGTPGGNNTDDKVFLPSIADMINTDYGFIGSYAHNDRDKTINRRCAPTAYAKAQGVYTNADYEHFTADGEEACWWWLRSPGSYADDAAGVFPDGIVDYYGGSVDGDGYVDDECLIPLISEGVRPAIKIILK